MELFCIWITVVVVVVKPLYAFVKICKTWGPLPQSVNHLTLDTNSGLDLKAVSLKKNPKTYTPENFTGCKF